MPNNLHTKMEQAWQYIWQELFCDKTHLFYDYRTNLDSQLKFTHLPTPEEIKRQLPNPCGWGTGMEDSMLNAGSIMEILRLRAEIDGDKEAIEQAYLVLEGMRLCTEVHGNIGFVARSVSPEDGKSCFANSSRDQFTLCVFGLWRFLRSFPNALQTERNKAEKILLEIAGYCEKTISDNNQNLLRLDGEQALVSDMVDVGAHELLRLPMIYAAAWDITGDKHWKTIYERHTVPAVEGTLKMDKGRCWNDWELAQLHVSLELLRTVDEKRATQYNDAMNMAAAIASRLLDATLEKAKNFKGDWSTLNISWRRMPMILRDETGIFLDQSSLYGGYPYLMPQPPQEYREVKGILRALGNLLFSLLYCHEYSLIKNKLRDIASILMLPDYLAHGSDAPINLLHGYWLARSKHLW